MPFATTHSRLVLTVQDRAELSRLAGSRSEPAAVVERAKMLLAFADGKSVAVIAKELATNRPRVDRCITKALQLGPLTALSDLPGRGRSPQMSPEDRTWVVSLACQKPKDLGYSFELWTTQLLMQHVREHCEANGHPTLKRIGRGTISKILTKAEVRPHKIQYYLERRDPEFDAKMAQVLCVYRDVELLRRRKEPQDVVAVVSFDEKPGIQAISNIAPDLPPVPGQYSSVGRDYEYVRHGTVSLMAGIDLLNGHVHGTVVDRHRSREFVAFLKTLDAHYPAHTKVRMILDNHSAHISKETRAYLATVPNRFEFVFTPKHGSWLNLIETFFSKMTRSMLRGIRVASKEELKERIKKYLAEVNEAPVVFRWKHGLDALAK